MKHPMNYYQILVIYYCDQCRSDVFPYSNYRPFRRTVQEKVFYGRKEEITDGELARFCKKGY